MQFPKVRRTRDVSYTPWTHTNQNLWGKFAFNMHNSIENILRNQTIATNLFLSIEINSYAVICLPE